ncbi:MAG: hypothetical protein WD273_02595 [Trueperaceae bacterium]
MNSKDLRDYLFRGLMFEAYAVSFQAAGIQVGADSRDAEEHLLAEALTPFSVVRRNQSLEMARLYAVLFCFENEVRDSFGRLYESLTVRIGTKSSHRRLDLMRKSVLKACLRIRGWKGSRRTFLATLSSVTLAK